jgi:hypothetical protein
MQCAGRSVARAAIRPRSLLSEAGDARERALDPTDRHVDTDTAGRDGEQHGSRRCHLGAIQDPYR